MTKLSKFTADLDVRIKQDQFMLLRGFYYYLEEDKECIIKVPRYFITDLASIPKFCRCFISYLGKHNKAAVIHDFLYSKLSDNYYLTRKQADNIFLNGMKILKVSKFKRYLMYCCVRVFGKFHYKKQ